MYKTIMTYLKSHPAYNGTIHAVAGVGLGILITYPLVGAHPLRWGILFLALGVLGHVYPLTLKRKK